MEKLIQVLLPFKACIQAEAQSPQKRRDASPPMLGVSC